MSTPTCTAGGKRRGKSRKTKGGGYGFGGGVINAGGIVYDANNTSEAYLPNGSKDAATNAAFSGDRPDANGMIGGRKSRKSRKTKKSKKTRKTRKTRGRKMRGGMYGANGGVVNAGGAGYGFVAGDPSLRGGIAPVAGYNANVGGAPMTAAGVRSV